MTLDEFRRSLSEDRPPADLGLALAALWWDARGDWDKAHDCAQNQNDATGAWVHAYLHRKEGDAANAGYWYRRAGKRAAATPFAEEWDAIARALLAPSGS